jgi:hypothetical protein
MARTDHKLSPPHALPRYRTRTFGPLAPTRTSPTHRASVRTRLAGLLFPLLVAGTTLVGCGRTDIDLPEGSAAEQMDYDVEVERDVELDDTSLVHVELVMPSPPVARADLMGLSTGVALEDVIASVCPDGSPIVELDATGEQPVLIVYMQDELRALIWM